MSLKITLGYKSSIQNGGGVYKNILVQLQLPNTVLCESTIFRFNELNFSGRQTPPVIKVYLYPTRESSPSDQKLTITATYQQVSTKIGGEQQNSLRTALNDVSLPLAFFVQIAPSQQIPKDQNDFKINLVLTKNAPSAVSLFEDVVECLQARELCTNKKQMFFHYHNQQSVSFLISKDDLKVRIQSTHFSSLWFIMNELSTRLHNLYGSGNY